jgi:hypothetical protein
VAFLRERDHSIASRRIPAHPKNQKATLTISRGVMAACTGACVLIAAAGRRTRAMTWRTRARASVISAASSFGSTTQ